MSERRRLRAAAALVLGVAVASWADSQVRIVHISFVQHNVDLRQPAPSDKWGMALMNAPIVQTEALRTEINGEAEVQLECGSAMRLAPDSQFSFPQLSLSGKGVRKTTVRVTRGTAFFTMRKADTADFHVTFPGGEVQTRDHKASFRIDVPARGKPAVELLDGQASVTVGHQTLVLRRAERLQLAASRPIWVPAPPPDQWQQWSQNRDKTFERELMAHALRASQPIPAPVPEIVTGAPDVNSQQILLDPGGAFHQMDAGTNMGQNWIPPAPRGQVPFCAQE